MSGPFRFTQEEAKSPLDRSSSPFTAGQPVNFKTNVNRAKTKKWVTAKKNAYDGDDWGDYDEYDEYGVDQEPPPSQHAPAQRYYAGAQQPQPQRTYTDRSFTEPHHQGPPGKARRNSFEAGQEARAFSASMPPPQHGYEQQQQQQQHQYSEPQRQTSGAESDMGHDPQDRRDFTPSAMPPPLQTRISAVPSDVGASASPTQYPPRKSSISQKETPIVASSPRSRTGSHSDKPLPFVRPADIYKRMEEERERERASLDSSRPSLDSLSSRPKDDLHSPTSDGGRMLQPLETVAERKSEYLPDFDAAFADPGRQSTSSGLQPQTLDSHAPVVPPPNDQGFRSVVDQAFTRTDDQRSIPPTPISKDSDSGMFRTNTGSTSGISPIMSRVPSSATSAMKRNHAEGDGSTPAIAEEPSDTARPVSQPTNTFLHGTAPTTASMPLPGHSRNISSSSLPRSGLATPTRGDSPARSPIIAPQKDLPEPQAAQIGLGNSDHSHDMEGGLDGPSPAYASREADIATAARSGGGEAAPGVGAAEKESQDAFLESHIAQSPIDDAFPRSRSESPSKGRVQALAGKFGDVSQSRRGSTQSNLSRNSVQSWEKSQDNSRAPSPTKGSPSKPSSPMKEFRPHLPGQWESYATTVPTPMDHSERDRSLGFENDKDSTSLEKTDLTPTTAKHPVAEVISDSPSDPLAALKSAGAAMAQSFRTTVGIDDNSSEPHDQHDVHSKGPSHGDMYKPRPLQLERTESSVSSIPPTPPAKDTPINEHPPQLTSQEADSRTPTQQRRPDFFPQLSTAPSADDEESDRLRKEIVASLTPVISVDPRRTSLQPVSPGTNRASSILPAEYDSYWADGGGNASPRPSQDAERSMPAITAIPKVSQAEEIAQPSLLNRFSWENNTPQLAKPEGIDKALPVPVPEPVKTSHEEPIPPPTVERAIEEERQQWSDGLPAPYFGPSHTFTVTKPDPLTEPDLLARSPTPPAEHNSLTSPTRERTRSPGLHVVNSAIDPEAVDLPPRLSADLSASEHTNQDDIKPLQQGLDRDVPNPAISTSVTAPEPASSVLPHEPAPTSPTSPTSGKPLGAREIATINSPAERIATYNQTRQHWATHDHGLEGWLSSALEANPELTSQTVSVRRPSTGTVRHKHTASLSLLGKLGSSNVNQSQATEQHQSPSTQAPIGGGSPTTGGPSNSTAAFDRRVASRQLEAKGKDLLHTANVLSGKGLTSAKGLFAKGKSRFGREKASPSRSDSMPSSREASEEPEFIGNVSRTATSTTVTPEKPSSHPSDMDSPRDEKKRRRFSISSFHRSSRSRSRPNSIALPSSTLFYSATPKGTPPREVSRILGEERGRPHSYHAPDSWNFVPGPHPPASSEPLQSTPPRERLQAHQSRLGVLPSPAKSAFSAHDQDAEQDIPPIPRIPDTVYLSDDLSHEVLQSVIRYATPPIPSVKSSGDLATGHDHHENSRTGFKEMQYSANGQTLSHPQQPHTLMTVAEFEAGRQRESSTQLPGDASTQVDYESTALPDVDQGQWPLLNHPQPGASVFVSGHGDHLVPSKQNSLPLTASGFTSQAFVSQVQHTMPPSSRDISSDRRDDDEDDQPPQLNYDPIPPSSKSDEIESLPSYLIPSHLDVSDDEDYNETRASIGGNGNSRLAAPQANKKGIVVEPLPPPKELQSAVQTQIPTRSEYADPETGATSNELASNVQQGGIDYATTTEFPAGNGVLQTNTPTMSDCNTRPSAINTAVPREAKGPLDWATETVGAGDISPYSSQTHEDDEATPKAEPRDQASSPAPVWFTKGDVQVAEEDGPPKLQPEATAAQGAMLTPHAAGSADRETHGPSRVSVSPFQVVHAVEEYAGSESSFASWDRDSVIARSVSASSPTGDMRDESDLVTPVAQVPHIVHNGRADKAEQSNDTSRMSAMPNGYFGGSDETPPKTMRHPQQQSSELAVPERSKSMLSMISSMVSESGTPALSPASSNAGRSTPSTIRRMQRDSSGKSPFTPTQIPEEAMSEDRTPTAKDDDFDLYADHNGIVKDVHDESGRPLRVAPPQLSDPRGHPHSVDLSEHTTAGASEARNEDGSRYSSERPMSFISGSTDQDGRPQDQVNQPLRQGFTTTRQIAEQLPILNNQVNPVPTGMVYSSFDPAQSNRQESFADTEQKGLQQHSSAQAPGTEYRQAHPVSHQDGRPHVAPSPTHSPQRTPASNISQQPIVNGQSPHPGPIAEHGLRDPQMHSASQGHVVPQPTAMQAQTTVSDNDPRFQRQASGSITRPRNEYELQQQMMQHQTQHPRLQGTTSPGNSVRPPVPIQQPPKQQDKSSSLPKLSSVFKGLGGKLQGNTQQTPHSQSAALRPDTHTGPVDPNRNASYHSTVSSLHREPPPVRSGDQLLSSVPPNRPRSNGAESHFSHISQGSTQVQPPTDSRTDLRKPTGPAPFQGIPPQLMPQRTTMQNGQLQAHRTGTSEIPEAGKKKRFSTLGNIFSRSSEGQSAKPKLSKEQKKAQKAQRSSTAPQMQASTPQWPPQQQQFRPHQPGMPYPPGQYPPGHYPPGHYPPGQYPPGQYPPGQYPPGQTLPAQQSRQMGPQFTSPQTMSPATPQSAQSMDPYGQTQHYQQMQPRTSLQQQTQGVPVGQESAYLRTKQLAEQHQAQKAQAPSNQMAAPMSRPGDQASNTSIDQHASQSRQTSYGPPPGGYYNPNPTPSKSEQGAYKTSQAARLLAEQQRQQSAPEQSAYGGSHSKRQSQQQQQPSAHDEEAYRALQVERHRLQLEEEQNQRSRAPSFGQEQQHPSQEQTESQTATYDPAIDGRRQPQGQQMLASPAERQQVAPSRQQSTPHGALPATSHEEFLRAQQGRQHQERMQQERLQQERLQQERLQQERLHHDRLQQERLQQERIQQERIQQERLQHDRLQQERLQQERLHQDRLQQEQQQQERLRQERLHQEQVHRSQRYPDRVQPASNHRSVSGPLPNQNTYTQPPVSQRHVSSPVEPQYEQPQIPAAYSHVSGAFTSPRDQESQSYDAVPQGAVTRPTQYQRQDSDPRMPSLSPQISAQSQMPPNNRTHSDASTVSVVSPMSTPAPDLPNVSNPSNQRAQKPKMSSISEIHQGTPERPWHLNFPNGATEQEIVRARQRQFMQQQFTAQQQQYADRAAQSPSPRSSPQHQSPTPPQAPVSFPPQQGGGFKELLPLSSPQPYTQARVSSTPGVVEQATPMRALQPLQPVSRNPEQNAQPAAYPLPMSPESANTRSPVNPLADALPTPPPPPPKLPHSPMHPMVQNPQPASAHEPTRRATSRQQYEPSPPQEEHYSPPLPQATQYEQPLPDEPPPSYDGPATPNDGMDKSRPEQTRPPNIATNANADARGREGEARQRQPSIGLLQHPQPASMAASPQHSSPNMGAESLRRQLLQQEDIARMERVQRAQEQRAESEREKQERDAARARARELERSVSGGARVGSIRSVAGSRNGGQPGWERRGSSSRQVFELPAVEDEEPSMRATSYPGQEWVPPVWTDD